MRADLLGLTFAEFVGWSRGLVGHADHFHRALYRQLIADGQWQPEQEPRWRDEAAASALPILIAAAAIEQTPTVVSQREAHDPQQGATIKVGLRLHDGAVVEAVLIPMRGGGRHTVCVSSQVGCKMGCSFCHTAKMGLIRSLSAHEIVGQVLAVARHTGVRPRNVVFMGMGEPLDNLDEVAQAVRVLTEVNGFGLGAGHITISTVGRVDGLARWAELGLERVNLAVSLTAADNELRSELMPVNRSADLATLKRALLALPLAKDGRILFSYVLIPGVNDGAAHAAAFLAWLDGLPAMVNLIPFNPIPSRPAWRAPTDDEVFAFRDVLAAAGMSVRLRLTKGDAVMAACGQLGEVTARKR